MDQALAVSWMEKVVADDFDPDILPFWEGLKRHQFLLARCGRCGAWYWPMACCREHDEVVGLEAMEWAPSSGRGVVFTWSVVHRVVDPAYADELPYALALVELQEGPLFPTRLVGCSLSEVRVGMPVEALFQDVSATGMTLPLFRPAPSRVDTR